MTASTRSGSERRVVRVAPSAKRETGAAYGDLYVLSSATLDCPAKSVTRTTKVYSTSATRSAAATETTEGVDPSFKASDAAASSAATTPYPRSAETETENAYVSARPPPPSDADASSATPSHGPSVVGAANTALGRSALSGGRTTDDPLDAREFPAAFFTTPGINVIASPGASVASPPKSIEIRRGELHTHSAPAPALATVAESKNAEQPPALTASDPPRSVSTSKTKSTRVSESETRALVGVGAGRSETSRRNGAPRVKTPRTRGASQYVPASISSYAATSEDASEIPEDASPSLKVAFVTPPPAKKSAGADPVPSSA